jgi:hypothetical protein
LSAPAFERALKLAIWVLLLCGCTRAIQLRTRQLNDYSRALRAHEKLLVARDQRLRDARKFLQAREHWECSDVRVDLRDAYPGIELTEIEAPTERKRVRSYRQRQDDDILNFRTVLEDVVPAPVAAAGAAAPGASAGSIASRSQNNQEPIEELWRTYRPSAVDMYDGWLAAWDVWYSTSPTPAPTADELEGFETRAAGMLVAAVAAWALLLIPIGARPDLRRRLAAWATVPAVLADAAFVLSRARDVNQFLQEYVSGLYVAAFGLLFTASLWLLPQLPRVAWRRRRVAHKPLPYYTCRHCGYELTANRSGACPECGCMTEEGRRRGYASVMARATAPLTLAGRGRFHLK